MRRRVPVAGRSARLSALALVFALVGGVTAACTPTGPTPPTPQEQFCQFWDKVAEAPPSPDNAVLVKTDVVALAETTSVVGSSCTASNAKVALGDATIAEGDEVPVEQGTTSTEVVAAINGEEVAEGEPVLDNVSVQALSADIGVNGITLRGNVNVRLSGVTSTIGFTGTLSNLENWSVNLSSTNLTIPGVTTSPVTFSGTLKVTNGVPALLLTAAASAVKIGGISVTGASLRFEASPVTGVAAKVTGTVKVGPSSATGTVDVAFDKAGALVSAKADLTARLRGFQTGGSEVRLDGTVHLEGNKTETAISFSGSGVLGTTVINEANGSLTLGVNRATLIGKIDVADGPNTIRFNGSIVWDGVTAVPNLILEGVGEYSGVMNDGQTVSVAGTISSEIGPGGVRAVVTGAFQIGTLKANGRAVVGSNGSTTTLEVDANLVDAGFAAHVEGGIVITDGVVEQIQLDAAVVGTVQLGDATLTGAILRVRSAGYGSPLDLSFSGGLRVGTSADLAGTVAASFGPNGALLSLDGNLTGSLQLGGWGLLGFAGSVLASPDQITLSGSGALSTTNFPLGVEFRGSFTSSLTTPSWSLNGSGRLRIGGLEIASARLTLSQTAGMRATRTGFYLSIIGIPTYLEADFYMNAGGGCSQVRLTGGSFLARPLARLILPGIVGCSVS